MRVRFETADQTRDSSNADSDSAVLRGRRKIDLIALNVNFSYHFIRFFSFFLIPIP